MICTSDENRPSCGTDLAKGLTFFLQMVRFFLQMDNDFDVAWGSLRTSLFPGGFILET